MSLLSVDNLYVEFATAGGVVAAVNHLSFNLDVRETLGIVGESGSGKTQAVMAVLGLLAENGRASGSVKFNGQEILNAPESELQNIRGRQIAMVFQDPMTSLNPYLTIQQQLAMVLKRHRPMEKRAAQKEILKMLDAVRLPNAARRMKAYPHEFSGGMRQRILIAAALLCRPQLLIADEATTSLDVTVQANILNLLGELRDAFGMGLIVISHDLAVIARTSDRMLVMNAGELVESGATVKVFANPNDTYTQRLLSSALQLDDPGRDALSGSRDPLLVIDDLEVEYRLPRKRLGMQRERFRAVRDVRLRVLQGETLGLVGESGCGKSSVARAIVGLVSARGGRVSILSGSTPIKPRSGQDVQMVFQDPLVSLNPRMLIRDIIAEPLGVHRADLSRAARRKLVEQMLEQVGLGQQLGDRYPHELSGGQCQRVGIARALITEPRLLVCDEAVSALDTSVQSGIVSLLIKLQQELGLTIIFIAHDLAVVKRMSHRIAVMYLGRIVEMGPAANIYAQPSHPYTRALLSAVPPLDPVSARQKSTQAIAIDVPAPWAPPSGCSYRTRCDFAEPICAEEIPTVDAQQTQQVACVRAMQLPPWLR